jgi:bile acid:Na+ symporter, BASS family
MSAGILLPAAGRLFEPYTLLWLGAVLFLNLLRLNSSDLIEVFKTPRQLVVLSIIKLVVLPVDLLTRNLKYLYYT